MIRCLRGSSNVWICGERESWQTRSRRVKLRGEWITRKASKTVVGRCKGMDETERDVEGARGLCGVEKVCQSYCPQRIEYLVYGSQDSKMLNMWTSSIHSRSRQQIELKYCCNFLPTLQTVINCNTYIVLSRLSYIWFFLQRIKKALIFVYVFKKSVKLKGTTSSV